jgi:FkbM family methyltransferase
MCVASGEPFESWGSIELGLTAFSVIENVLMMYARRFPIRRGKLRIIDSLWETVLSDSNTVRMATLKHGKFKMACDLNEMLQRQFYFFGTYFLEEDILRCWEASAKRAKVVLDVGANAGIYSLAALAVQPDVVVHAFEPTPEIAARLRATAKLNGLENLYVHEVAVLRDDGQATLKRFRGELGNNEGMNFVIKGIGNSDIERVKTVSLDRFCQDHSIAQVDLLKLDVQGQEYSALKGAEHLIKAGRIGTIFMELNWSRSTGTTCAATESIQFLVHADYLFSRPGKRPNWKVAGDWLYGLNDVVAHRARA